MTRVDERFSEAARRLLQHGFLEADVPGAQVRPRWEDGVPARTKYLPQQVFSYEPGEVPLIHYRRIAWKTAIRELLWIYQDHSNDVQLLKEKYNVHYWDSWQDEKGTLGTAYGYQIAKRFRSPENGEMTNQIDRLIHELRTNPLNRRLFMTLLDMDDLADMTLIPCAFMTLWTVTENRLNCTLIQRSGDFLAAASPGGINAFQYYVLLRMIAQVTGYQPGQFVHFVQNLHIYDRHEAILRKVLEVDVSDKRLPELKINPERKEFGDFREEDFELIGYEPDRTAYSIPIAI
ncbi:MAG: thymidylate synthase [Ndongobacter sp.]|nr:thymidylate synthase [Ndongobacter sp.]